MTVHSTPPRSQRPLADSTAGQHAHIQSFGALLPVHQGLGQRYYPAMPVFGEASSVSVPFAVAGRTPTF